MGKNAREIRITFDTTRAVDVEVIVRDPRKLRRLVLEPLAMATEDPKPLRYEHAGTMMLPAEDGSVEAVHLFHPWGRCKRGEKYLIVDLSLLAAHYA